MGLQTLRIFISSPGDVGQERVIAGRVLERLQGEFAGYVTLEPILWEHEPLRATDHFQKQIVTPSSADIVVCILWSRLGTRLPPDQFRRHDGSLYSSGTEWEFEDAALSFLSKGTPDLLVYRKTSDPPLAFHDERAVERLEQRRALDVFIDRWFGNSQSGFKAAFTGFRTPDEFEDILEVHLRKLIKERLPDRLTSDGEDAVPVSWYKGTPYRGLEAFDYDHAAVFFGRTKAIGAVKEALIRQAEKGCAFVLVFGMSGGGKSSLVRAGVLPTITQPGVIEGVGLWRWSIFRPSDAAGNLFVGLAKALLVASAVPEMSEDIAENDLATQLRDVPRDAVVTVRGGLMRAAQTVMDRENLVHRPETRLALVVDQLEELFTREQIDVTDRESFMAALEALAQSGQVWILGTMRSDFYPRCQDLPALVAMKEGAGTYDLLPPTSAEIGQMIRFPTRAAGLRFEADTANGVGLDDVLLEAAIKDPEGLPLLEFTLDELFRRRTDDRILTFAAYRELGGLEGALARRADEIFEALAPDVQEALPAVLRSLVTVGTVNEVLIVSRRVALSSVATTPPRKALTEAFISARLLVTDRADNGEAVVRVAHEALLHHWPRLQQWLADDRDFLRARARVAEAARLWEQEDRRSDFLLVSGKPLAEAEDIVLHRRADLEPELLEFVAASERKVNRARRVRTATISIIAALFFSVVTAFSIFSYGEAKRARREAVRAQQQRGVAEAQSRLARQQTLLADQQRQAALAQRAIAQQKTRLALQQQRLAEQRRLEADKQRQNAEAQKQIAQTNQQIAVAQKAVAERNFQQAFHAADAMVTDLAEGIKPIAGTQSTTVKKILISASNVYAGLLKAGATPPVLEGKARMLNSFVEIYLKLNDTGKALASAQESLGIYKSLLQKDPQNLRLQEGLARSHELLASVIFLQGAISRSIDEYRIALAIRKHLVSSNIKNATWQANLSNAYSLLAGDLSEQGDKQGVTQAHIESLRIRTGLATRYPSRMDFQRILAASLSQQGDDYWYADDLDDSEKCYRAALRDALNAARQDSSNADIQKIIANSYENLGYVAKQRGSVKQALTFFAQASDLAAHFSDLDPNAADWLGLLLDCRLQRADVSANPLDPGADLIAQLALLDEILPKMSKLAAGDPQNAFTLQRLLVIENDRAVDCARLAQLGVSPVKYCLIATQSCHVQLAIAQKLSRLDPTSERWNGSLTMAYTALFSLSNAQGRDTEALRYEAKGVEAKCVWYRQKVIGSPQDLKIKKTLADYEMGHAGLLATLAEKKIAVVQNYGLALPEAMAACDLYGLLCIKQPPNTAAEEDLAKSCMQVAVWYKQAAEAGCDRRNNMAKALPLFIKSEAIYKRLCLEKPSDLNEWKQLGMAENELAVFYNGQGSTAQWQIYSQKEKDVEAHIEPLLSKQLMTDLATIVRDDTHSQEASNTQSAMTGLGGASSRPLLLQEYPLAVSMYNRIPTTQNFGTLLSVSLQLTEMTLKTPSDADLVDVQQKLQTAYFLFSQKQKQKTLTPAQEESQKPLLHFLDAAFSQIDIKRIPALQAAVQQKPDDAAARSRLGSTLFANKQYEAALAQMREVDRLKPGDGGTINGIGAALYQLGQIAPSIPEFRVALKLLPDSALIHANLGAALALNGQGAEALTQSQEAVRLDPSLPNAHYALGLALSQSGQRAAARAEWQRVLTMGDDDVAAQAKDALAKNP